MDIGARYIIKIYPRLNLKICIIKVIFIHYMYLFKENLTVLSIDISYVYLLIIHLQI